MLSDVDFLGNGAQIGESAFSSCKMLSDINFAGSGIQIGKSAFSSCTGLEKLVVPDSVASVGQHAFGWCTGLKDLTTPCGSDYYWGSAVDPDYGSFVGCKSIENLTITKGRDGEYYNKGGCQWYPSASSLKHVKVAEGVKSLGTYMFGTKKYVNRYDSFNLQEIELPSTLERVAQDSFYYDSIEKVTYHGNLNSWCAIEFTDGEANPLSCAATFFIGDEEVKDLIIPEEIDTIMPYAFYHCNSMISVTIPEKMKTVRYYAFYGCNNVTDVYFADGQERWNAIVIENGNDPLQNAYLHLNSQLLICKDIQTDETLQCVIIGNQIQVSGDISEVAAVYIAQYNQNGRMASVSMFTEPFSLSPSDDLIQIMWIDTGDFHPKCKSVKLENPSLGF